MAARWREEPLEVVLCLQVIPFYMFARTEKGATKSATNNSIHGINFGIQITKWCWPEAKCTGSAFVDYKAIFKATFAR